VASGACTEPAAAGRCAWLPAAGLPMAGATVVVVVVVAGRAALGAETPGAETLGAETLGVETPGAAGRAGVVALVVVVVVVAVAAGLEAKAGAAATRSAVASSERRIVIWSVLPAPSGIGRRVRRIEPPSRAWLAARPRFHRGGRGDDGAIAAARHE
jgi:hypothetical protein